MLTESEIAALLSSSGTIALVGASSRPERDSFDQMRYFRQEGYRVIPVNPSEEEVLGERAYASLEEIPEPVDVVFAFRRAGATPPVVRSAGAIGARAVWLPLGVADAEARRLAEALGLGYVEDRCPKTTHRLMQRCGLLGAPGLEQRSAGSRGHEGIRMNDAEAVVKDLAARHPGLFDWTGVYWVAGDVLELGPYVGPHPDGHERIRIPEGVCGSVAETGETEVVPDVSKRPGHIACELSTRSEVVAPIIRSGRVIGVLDVDSNTLDAFGPAEVAAVEQAAGRIAAG